MNQIGVVRQPVPGKRQSLCPARISPPSRPSAKVVEGMAWHGFFPQGFLELHVDAAPLAHRKLGHVVLSDRLIAPVSLFSGYGLRFA